MKRSQGWVAVLPSLVIPICFGLMMYMGLLLCLSKEWITSEVAIRYITGHPISKLTLILFFVGTASLMLIAFNVFKQFSFLEKISLHLPGPDGEATQDSMGMEQQVAEYEEQLTGYTTQQQTHYLWTRLKSALDHIGRTQSTNDLSEHLQYLAVQDQEFQEQRYSLVRILIWATPMLGFLGTVLGISAALGSIDVGPDNDFAKMMTGLRGSLYVAFDTTALALILSMILMFGQFLVDRFESQLLRNVDSQAKSKLAFCFETEAKAEVATDSMERIGKTVLLATHEVVQKQTELWEKSMQSAERAWVETVTGANKAAGENLENAVDRAVENMAHYLGKTIGQADQNFSHRWNQWQVALSENVRRLHEHQSELASQTNLVHRLLEELQALGREKIEASNKDGDTLVIRELECTLKELSSVIQRLDSQMAIKKEEEKKSAESGAEDSESEVVRPALHVIEGETGTARVVDVEANQRPSKRKNVVNSILSFASSATSSIVKKSA